MRYSIGQVAKKLGLTAHTLRYYDKEGLLPFVRKGSSGARVFEDEDVDWLIIIECLKGTGMQLKDIKNIWTCASRAMQQLANGWNCLNGKKKSWSSRWPFSGNIWKKLILKSLIMQKL